jgi:xanthine dehydrogenase accessory factor
VTPLALATLARALGTAPDGPPAVLVTVQRVQGSAPREEGAWMAVFADQVVNTLGGGHLEFSAIALASQWLAGAGPAGGAAPALDGPGAAPRPGAGLPATAPFTRRIALGPSLGQCCGGAVELRFERVQGPLSDEWMQRLQPRGTPVALFGGGHVGKALVRILATLPFEVRWLDSRDEIFPPDVPAHVHCEHSDPVHAAVADLSPGSQVLVMSFSHAEDLDIVQACLQRQRLRGDLPFIGLIGSKTKWATFGHRLLERGFSAQECAQITCPIGIAGISGKEPEVIAVAVAAQLLQLAGHKEQGPS